MEFLDKFQMTLGNFGDFDSSPWLFVGDKLQDTIVYWGLVNLSRQILGQSFVRSEIAQFRPKHAFEAFRFPTALENICKLWQFPIVLLSTETPEPLFLIPTNFQQCSIGKRVSHCRRSKYQAFALFLVWACLHQVFLKIRGWEVCDYFRLKAHFHI